MLKNLYRKKGRILKLLIGSIFLVSLIFVYNSKIFTINSILDFLKLKNIDNIPYTANVIDSENKLNQINQNIVSEDIENIKTQIAQISQTINTKSPVTIVGNQVPTISQTQLILALEKLFVNKLPDSIISKLKGPQGEKGDMGPQGAQGPQGINSVQSSTPVTFNTTVSSAPQTGPIGILGGFASLGAQNINTSTLNVSGNSVLSGNLTVAGSTTFSGGTSGTVNPSFTLGSIAFQGVSGLTEDNANLFYDDTNNRLGIGTTTPGSVFDVKGTLRFSGATSGYVGFVPASVAGSVTYTLPSADGTNGQFLKTDGSGILSWVTASGSGDALVANPLSQFASTTSLQLAGVISDETGTGALVFATSPILVTPNLGTPSALVGTNISGTASNLTAGTATTATSATTATNLAGGLGGQIPYQSSAGITAMLANGNAGQVLQSNGTTLAPSWVTLGGGGDALTANPLSQFASTTSLQLLGVISDETGTGALVFATSPILVTPNLGTPSALVGTNISGTASNLTAGLVTNATLTTALTVNTGTVTLTGNVANTSVLTIGAGAVTVSGANTGDQTNITGNAGTATALQNARTIGGVSFDGTANITVATATGGFTISGGALALGANNLTMTGSLGATGARLTKGWFTDLEITNLPSVNGTALTTTIDKLNYLTSVGGTTGTASTNLVFSTSPTFATSITGSYLTASEILITDGSKNIVSAPVATYPSLTELSYVKGLSSAIQNQINGKQASDAELTALAGLSYSSNALKVIRVNAGADGFELATPTVGTVTSIAMSVPTGLTISGSPITSSGTLAVALDTGYVIPLQTTLDGKANSALSNLASVAINTSLISDGDSTDDLGSSTIAWRDLFVDTIKSITGNALNITPFAGQNLNVNLSTTGDFAVNTNQLYVDTSAGNVGIGTTAPIGPLHIKTSSITSATGGTITESGGYTIHTFTSSGTFTPTGTGAVEYLVVGGGGSSGGGSNGGGGGGGGGFLTGSTNVSGQLTVTVGAGGAGGSSPGSLNGENSVFGNITANGGGGGGNFPTDNASNGGSGGGASSGGTPGTGVVGQGNDGGSGDGGYGSGGGGGGAGAVGGSSGASANGGNGGNGLSSSISGSAVTYAGGGGGGGQSSQGTGGTGGGGSNSSGTPNTGGGGGGGWSVSSRAGGSGIVIVRYLTVSPVGMLVNSSGNVGIGTTAPGAQLDLSTDSARKLTSTTWTTGSDSRIKTEVESINDALNIIGQINPVKFKYTEEYRNAHPSIVNTDYYSFIAQEYMQVFPNSVTEINGLYYLNSSNMIPYAIAGIKELDLKIVGLEERVASLEENSFKGDEESIKKIFGEYAYEFFNVVLKKIENGVLYLKALVVDTFTIGNAEKPAGFTIYDKTTREPFCVSMISGELISLPGTCTELEKDLSETISTEVSNNSTSSGDTIAPIITLNGESSIILAIGDTYIEEGATAIDDVDGETIVITSGAVDTNTSGIYTVSYTAMDTAGNTALAQRIVSVNGTSENIVENTEALPPSEGGDTEPISDPAPEPTPTPEPIPEPIPTSEPESVNP